jgi:protein-S-isoprenylcysteine O-methyltransferase Ste14
MTRFLILIYGFLAYALFLPAILYLIGFLGDFAVPKTVDSGAAGALVPSILRDVLLLALFGLQHSLMARAGFKKWWTRIVPPAAERSTYVLISSLTLIGVYAFWAPIPAEVWSVTNPAIGTTVLAIFWAGWAILFLSTFLLNHFALFGLQQVYAALRGRDVPAQPFSTPGFYKFVRHPIYFGFLLGFWATPVMTVGHLVFAAAGTVYIVIGTLLEERDLIAHFGDTYLAYRKRVGMFLPWRARAGGDA